MGPQSYNIFSNDILLLIDNDVQINNYADDNTLLCTGFGYDSVKETLLRKVNNVTSWFEANCMKANVDKFQYIVFGKCHQVDNFIIRDNVIKPKHNIKILGLHLDNELNLYEHVSKLCRKADKKVQVLSRLNRVRSEYNKLLLYSCFVECHFNNCRIF